MTGRSNEVNQPSSDRTAEAIENALRLKNLTALQEGAEQICETVIVADTSPLGRMVVRCARELGTEEYIRP